MQVLYERTLKSGRRHALIELEENEQIPRFSFLNNAFYCIKQPSEKVIPGYALNNAVRVMWCADSQAWLSYYG